MTARSSEKSSERFTVRLEAFSDLVFGFSLSLLATRLDVPTRAEDIFEPKRWIAIIGTFAFVCRFWLEHYRVFRHHFVARTFDAIVNFVFLFAIAVLPYAVQAFLRFQSYLPSFTIYVGDFSLILFSLALLRFRGLCQRRADPDLADRLWEWRRFLMQLGIALLMCAFLLALHFHGGTLEAGVRDYGWYAAVIFAAIILGTRRGIKRLPGFLT